MMKVILFFEVKKRAGFLQPYFDYLPAFDGAEPAFFDIFSKPLFMFGSLHTLSIGDPGQTRTAGPLLRGQLL